MEGGLKCERGRTDGRAELMLLKEEEMDDRLKGRRRDDLHGMQRQEWEAGRS